MNNYRKGQFDKVKTSYSDYKTKVKFIKPNGETNWMDITNNEFSQIVELLTNGKVSKNAYGEIIIN